MPVTTDSVENPDGTTCATETPHITTHKAKIRNNDADAFMGYPKSGSGGSRRSSHDISPTNHPESGESRNIRTGRAVGNLHSPMKIRSITLYRADIRMKEPFRIATMTVDVAQCVYVAVLTDDGRVGWGEANPYWRIVGETQNTVLAAGADLARLLIGSDPTRIHACHRTMAGFLAGNTTARSMFEMALWDLLAQSCGAPLWKVLGGTRAPIPTDRTVGIDTPENMARAAVGYRDRGFPAVKLKIGRDPATDVRAVRAVRAAVGPDIPLRIDANQGFDATTAARVLRELESTDIQYCEQPVPAADVDGLAFVRSRTRIPIMADEAVFTAVDASRLAKSGACDYMNLKLSKTGGIAEALRASAVAEAAGIRCAIGCMTESRLGLTAAAHFANACGNVVFADLDGADFHAEDPVVGGITYGNDGTVLAPESPGLGAHIHPDFLARCATTVIE